MTCAAYSAATATSGTNCDTHLFRRLTFSRYIASNSASGNECVEGRCHQRVGPGLQPRIFLDQADRPDAVEEEIALQERRIGGIDQRIFRAVEERAAALCSSALLEPLERHRDFVATAFL